MDYLKCFLCGNVANPVTLCGNGSCGKFYCKSCIANHMRTDPNCPNPKSVHSFKEGEVWDMFKEALSSMKFHCENCGLVYNYNECFTHRKYCM